MDQNRVLCLHSSGSRGVQWRKLSQALGQEWEVCSPDLTGYSETNTEESFADFRVDDEISHIEQAFDCDAPFHLVGHSYGAYVALRLALKYPQQVRSICVFEPACWTLVTDDQNEADATLDIDQMRSSTYGLVDSGALQEAAEGFVNYWAGSGAWNAIPEERKQSTTREMRKIVAEFRSEELIHHKNSNAAGQYSDIIAPVLYLIGSHTTPGSRAVSRKLVPYLQHVEFVEIDNAGHMGPMTHADQVLPRIGSFLETHCNG